MLWDMRIIDQRLMVGEVKEMVFDDYGGRLGGSGGGDHDVD